MDNKKAQEMIKQFQLMKFDHANRLMEMALFKEKVIRKLSHAIEEEMSWDNCIDYLENFREQLEKEKGMEEEFFRMDREQLLEAKKKLNDKGVYTYDSLINWLLMGL